MSGSKLQDSGYYEPYASFARTLRTWLVAYGIGVPAIFLTEEQIASKLVASGFGSLVVGLFLFGTFLQVASALLWKTTMWYLGVGERSADFKKTKRYKFSDYVSDQYWIDMVFDIGTVSAFGIATWRLFSAALGS